MRWGWVECGVVPVFVGFTPVCMPCHLFGLTSQQVRYSDDEERGYTAEGESINAVMAREWTEGPASVPDACNSTENTAATSTWLPGGANDDDVLWRISARGDRFGPIDVTDDVCAMFEIPRHQWRDEEQRILPVLQRMTEGYAVWRLNANDIGVEVCPGAISTWRPIRVRYP